MADKRDYSESNRCGHCHNVAPMVIRTAFSQYSSDEQLASYGVVTAYELLECLACDGMTLRSADDHEHYENQRGEWTVLHPTPGNTPDGLPDDIQQAHRAASAVRGIDPNIYGSALRAVLERVCEDKDCTKGSLDDSIKQLAKDGHIPMKIAEVAHKLRDLGNIGTHPKLGELSSAEPPILDKLCRAILEHVYSIPKLVTEAEASLDKLRKTQAAKKKRKKKKKKK